VEGRRKLKEETKKYSNKFREVLKRERMWGGNERHYI
jgi:hypothetical protein